MGDGGNIIYIDKGKNKDDKRKAIGISTKNPRESDMICSGDRLRLQF